MPADSRRRPPPLYGARLRRRQPGLFPKATVDLLQTFAAQSVLAIQNARLFTEIEEKGAWRSDLRMEELLGRYSHHLESSNGRSGWVTASRKVDKFPFLETPLLELLRVYEADRDSGTVEDVYHLA